MSKYTAISIGLYTGQVCALRLTASTAANAAQQFTKEQKARTGAPDDHILVCVVEGHPKIPFSAEDM